MNTSILVVDDDDAHRGMLRMMLQAWGYSVDEAADGDLAVEAVRAKPYDVVLTDVRMGRMDGIHALRGILDYNPALPVVLMTAYSSVETAVDALRLGAYDYLTKPLDFDALRETLQRAVDHSRMSVENRELRRQLSEAAAGPEILGRSPAVSAMREIIATVAPTEATVLITGESGTGKELVARAVHGASARANKPLVTVNCAALAENLLESELFGHERGAFTGADRRREGRFLQADGGTLFLDEIGEMPLSLQAKLLRALQQGEVQRVGSDSPITVDVRVIAATNRNLREEVEQKRFREDLFFRLNVISIEVPALRERSEDIPLLAAHFLEKFAARNRKNVKGFAPQALDMLRRYSWPGNVRELQNAVERAVILCTGDLITGPELPASVTGAAEQAAPVPETAEASLAGLSLEALERRAIEDTLRQTEDNKSEAARRLGITRATLHNKLRKYGLEGNPLGSRARGFPSPRPLIPPPTRFVRKDDEARKNHGLAWMTVPRTNTACGGWTKTEKGGRWRAPDSFRTNQQRRGHRAPSMRKHTWHRTAQTKARPQRACLMNSRWNASRTFSTRRDICATRRAAAMPSWAPAARTWPSIPTVPASSATPWPNWRGPMPPA